MYCNELGLEDAAEFTIGGVRTAASRFYRKKTPARRLIARGCRKGTGNGGTGCRGIEPTAETGEIGLALVRVFATEKSCLPLTGGGNTADGGRGGHPWRH